MITLAWMAVGWLLMSVVTAFGSRLNVGHVMPDIAALVIVFLALRREPILVALVALALGYMSGRQAVAPVGIHESAAVLCAIGAYVASGSIAGGGKFFFVLASGGAAMAYHVCIFLLAYLVGGAAGFSSLATMTLIPTALATSVVAWLLHPLLAWIDKKLAPEQREALSWR